MRIIKKKINRNKLIKLKLIETKIYETNYKNSVKITDIATKLKKALHIIYKYHISNKKILFVGPSIKLYNSLNKLFKTTKHLILPRSVWMNGILTNPSSCSEYLQKNQQNISSKFSKTLFQLNNKLDLIVILDSHYKNNILNESYITKTPAILIGNFESKNESKTSYQVPGNFKFSGKKIREDFFSLILIAMIKKVNKLKNKRDKYRLSPIFNFNLPNRSFNKNYKKKFNKYNVQKKK
jgi:ribosomal protein S2